MPFAFCGMYFSACRKDNGNGGSDEQTGSAASGDSTASSANDLVLPYSNNDSLNPFLPSARKI